MLLAVFLLHLVSCCHCWDNEDLELFDLVEEVNENFYDVMGISQTSTSSEIRKAYRKLSLQIHPDKNKEEGADIRFRQLVAIYEVLKDEDRRRKYDEVLVTGLPDWRQPVFYYRRVRKMGLLELSVLLFLIITVGHFLVAWSIYAERKFTQEEVFRSKKKMPKGKRKQKQQLDEAFEAELQEFLAAIPRPQLKDAIPCKILRGSIWAIIAAPAGAAWLCAQIKNIGRKQEEEELLEEDESEDSTKRPRRQRIQTPDAEFKPEMSEYQAPVSYDPGEILASKTDLQSTQSMQEVKDGWTDEDLTLLAKAVAKFPGGTSQRWERIAEYIRKTPKEAITMAKKMKLGMNRPAEAAQGIPVKSADNVAFKKSRAHATIDDHIISTRETDNNVSSSPVLIAPEKSNKNEEAKLDNDAWTQNQQKILEWCLTQYPKGTAERWEKIAEHIPGKTKEDCIARFKFLADIVKKRKQAASQDSSSKQKTS